MSQHAVKGSWVEVGAVVLRAGERAPNLPEDTKQVPLEMRVKGFLLHDAEVGREAEIVTASGRTVNGKLVDVNPVYAHGFGRPIPELSPIAGEIRAILRERGKAP